MHETDFISRVEPWQRRLPHRAVMTLGQQRYRTAEFEVDYTEF